MTISGMWIRFFDSIGKAGGSLWLVWFCGWLLLDKRVGHRAWISIAGIYCLIQTVSSVGLSQDMYFHGKVTKSWMSTLSMLFFLAFVFWTSHQKYHLKKTLRTSETEQFVRVEKQLDRSTLANCKEFQAERILAQSRDLRRQQREILANSHVNS